MSASLVGSEMCIRDSCTPCAPPSPREPLGQRGAPSQPQRERRWPLRSTGGPRLQQTQRRAVPARRECPAPALAA
eukprot:4366938-Alexandrium_andersonii.AAC.1